MLPVPKERVQSYLTTVTDTKLRSTLTKSRLSEHSLAIETGRYKQSWLPKEERFCQLCKRDKVETELHFLTECRELQPIRTQYFPKFKHKHPTFDQITNINKMPILLGEQPESCSLAAEYVFTCHTHTHTNTHTHTHTHTHNCNILVFMLLMISISVVFIVTF